MYPDFDSGDDDSSISAVFRGKRNLNSYLQLMMGDLDAKNIALNFQENVIPLLDENKFSFLVRLLQMMLRQDEIDDETHVELVNGIRKKDLIRMDEVVLEDFLAGVFLYLIKNTDNLHREKDVKLFISYAKEFEKTEYKKIDFIEQYSANDIFENSRIRPIITLYKNASCIIDVVALDLFKIPEIIGTLEKVNIVIPVNTSFETRLEGIHGELSIPLVSENTIHGQWINYMNNRGYSYSKLDMLIDQGLKKNRIAKCGVNSSLVGKTDIYPIASSSIVSIDGIEFFLLAVSKFNEKNKAESKINYIRESLESMIELYDIEGQGFDLYVPLVGAGRSRTGMSIQEAYELLVETVMSRKNEIYGRIHITIHPSQITEVKLEDKKNVILQN